MNKKILFAIVVLIALSFSSTVIAHPASQQGILDTSYISHHPTPDYYIGGDAVGWSIDEGCHSNNSTITWQFSTGASFTNAQKSIIRDGASRWLSVTAFSVYFEEKYDGTGTGVIETMVGTPYALAQFSKIATNNYGHLTSWKIKINTAYSFNASVVAHEFGHAIGLNDLGGSSSSGKLMYYAYNTTTNPNKYPTAQDRKGAELILGYHTAHTWGYKYYSTTSSGNKHVKYCTHCGGYSLVKEFCTYNSANVCTKCGTPKGASPTSITIPTIYLPG